MYPPLTAATSLVPSALEATDCQDFEPDWVRSVQVPAAFAGVVVATALNRLAINATTRMIALGALDLSILWVISMAFWSLEDGFIRVFQKCGTLSEMSKKCV